MGFGLLTVGYLLVSVLHLTAQAIGLGGFASLAGYALIFYALSKLVSYQRTFLYAKWLSVAALIPALYDCVCNVADLLLLELPIMAEPWVSIFKWSDFLLDIVFLFAVLYAIRMLGVEVGLKSTAVAALRDTLVVGLYAALYIVWNFPLPEAARPYLTMSVQVFEFLVMLLMLLLFIQCAKNICPEGDEEVAPKRSRFEWVNRIGDAYDRTQTRLREQSKADGAEFMRRRHEKKREKQQQKKNRKGKH